MAGGGWQRGKRSPIDFEAYPNYPSLQARKRTTCSPSSRELRRRIGREPLYSCTLWQGVHRLHGGGIDLDARLTTCASGMPPTTLASSAATPPTSGARSSTPASPVRQSPLGPPPQEGQPVFKHGQGTRPANGRGCVARWSTICATLQAGGRPWASLSLVEAATAVRRCHAYHELDHLHIDYKKGVAQVLGLSASSRIDTPVLHPRRCPALGYLAPFAGVGSEGRGRRATEGGRRPVGRFLRRRRAVGGLRTRNHRGAEQAVVRASGGRTAESLSGEDPARLLPRYSARRSRRRPGATLQRKLDDLRDDPGVAVCRL